MVILNMFPQANPSPLHPPTPPGQVVNDKKSDLQQAWERARVKSRRLALKKSKSPLPHTPWASCITSQVYIFSTCNWR